MDKKSAIKQLKLIKQVFDKKKVPFLLAYGTCLGAYRDKDFLPGDKDIDLVVTEPIDYKTRKDLGWTLYYLGFETSVIGFNVFGRYEPAELGYNGYEKTGIIVCEKEGIEITIFFFCEDDCKEHGKEMTCVPKMGAMKLISSPSKFYKKPDTLKFFGEKFLVPGPVEEYLKFTYEDWKDTLKRDHGLTHFEMHPEQVEIIENIMEKNQVYYALKRDEEIPRSPFRPKLPNR